LNNQTINHKLTGQCNKKGMNARHNKATGCA